MSFRGLRNFDKTGHFAVLIFCAAPVLANQYISMQIKTQFTLNLVQTSLLPAFKNNWKWFQNCYDWPALEKRTWYDVQGLRVDKVIKTRIWKVPRIVTAMFIKKIKKAISCFQIEVFFLVIFLCFFCVTYVSICVFCVSSTPFHSHFRLSLEKQSSRGHILIGCRISIKL